MLLQCRAMTAPDDELARLKSERETLIHRIGWWEDRRIAALLPMAVLAFGAGFGLGYAAHAWLGAPYPAAYFSGIAALFLSGRVVDHRYSPTRLHRLDLAIDRLERARRKA